MGLQRKVTMVQIGRQDSDEWTDSVLHLWLQREMVVIHLRFVVPCIFNHSNKITN